MKFHQVTWYSKLLALILFIALPFAGFYAGMKYQEAVKPTDDSGAVVNDPTTNGSGWKTIVSTDQVVVKTKYENNTLKYTGTVQLPTPCYQLKQDALVAESYPEQVQIRITTSEDKAPDVGYCTQVVTPKEFSGEAKVSKEAVVSVYLDGKKVD